VRFAAVVNQTKPLGGWWGGGVVGRGLMRSTWGLPEYCITAVTSINRGSQEHQVVRNGAEFQRNKPPEIDGNCLIDETVRNLRLKYIDKTAVPLPRTNLNTRILT